MMTLLRSCFIVLPTDNEEFFFRNVSALADSGLGFTSAPDITVWKYIQDFVRVHTHVPGIKTLRAHFERIGEDEVVDRLEILAAMVPIVRGNFISRLENRAEDRRIRVMGELIRDASTILTTGMDIKEGRDTRNLRGPRDAYYHLMDNSDQVITPTLGGDLAGEVLASGQRVEDQYLRVKADPLAGIGQMTGLLQMDVLCGAKRKELWIHAGFTGGMKSTFMLNWLYNQAVYYLHDSLLFSLEMPFEQCLNMLYAMHSFHEKFKPIRHQLGLQLDPDAEMGLDYIKIKTGVLGDAEEEFFLQHVIPDFKDPKNHYGKIHIEVADPNKGKFTMSDLRRVAARLYSKSPYSVIAVDHVDNMEAEGKVSGKTEKLNGILRALKMLALYFNGGQGMAVVGLYQINRDGYKQALKAKEKTGTALYNLTALSHSSEAERSADIVTASWSDKELVDRNRVQFQCLKVRDMAAFALFLARVEWGCRRILTCFDVVDPSALAKKKTEEAKKAMEDDKELDDALETMNQED